jgi:hypothetical protein
VTSRLGTGISKSFFYGVLSHWSLPFSFVLFNTPYNYYSFGLKIRPIPKIIRSMFKRPLLQRKKKLFTYQNPVFQTRHDFKKLDSVRRVIDILYYPACEADRHFLCTADKDKYNPSPLVQLPDKENQSHFSPHFRVFR